MGQVADRPEASRDGPLTLPVEVPGPPVTPAAPARTLVARRLRPIYVAAFLRLHDAVPSTIRAGVASGVGTLTWLVFLPFAFVFGAVSDRSGVHHAGWTLIATAIVTVGLLAWTVHGLVRAPAAVPLQPAFATGRFRPPDDPEWPGHWADPPTPWDLPGVRLDSDATLAEVRAAIADLPAVHRDVLVRRDVEGRPPAEVQEALGLRPHEERDLLNQARGHVRTRLNDHLEDGPR